MLLACGGGILDGRQAGLCAAVCSAVLQPCMLCLDRLLHALISSAVCRWVRACKYNRQTACKPHLCELLAGGAALAHALAACTARQQASYNSALHCLCVGNQAAKQCVGSTGTPQRAGGVTSAPVKRWMAQPVPSSNNPAKFQEPNTGPAAPARSMRLSLAKRTWVTPESGCASAASTTAVNTLWGEGVRGCLGGGTSVVESSALQQVRQARRS